MPAKKKRASVNQSVPDPKPPTALPQSAGQTIRPLPTIDETRPLPQLEDMLAAEADESVLKKKNTVLYAAGGFGAAAVIIAALLIFAAYLAGPRLEKTTAPAAAPSVTVAPTATPVPVRLTIEVLNASGAPGAAAKAAQSLSARGYEIIRTGNAVRSKQSAVFVSPQITAAQTADLLKDLTELFGIASGSGELQDSTASARVIIGSNK